MIDGFEELLKKIVLKHPRYSVEEIVAKLYGEDRIASKTKLFYRKLNPFDQKAFFNPVDLLRLIGILNERMSPEERESIGGDALVHHICGRFGLVAVAPPDASKSDREALLGSIKALSKAISALAEAAEPETFKSASAVTMVLQSNYEAQASLVNIKNLVKSGEAGQ